MPIDIGDVKFVFMNKNLTTWKRGTKLVLASHLHNSGKPFVVTYFKKVRNSDHLIEVLFPFEIYGGGYHRVDRSCLSEVK